MLRPVTTDDSETLVELTAGTGFFKPLELEALREVLDDYHAGNAEINHRCFLWEESSRVIGYVYHAPAPMTDRAWYLYWIAVAKDQQGRGIGRKLLDFVESDVRGQDGRMLLIETSSTLHYEPTRRFYLKAGYALAANIADFYSDGDGLIVFAKRIAPPSTPCLDPYDGMPGR